MSLLKMYHLIFKGQRIQWGVQEICKFFYVFSPDLGKGACNTEFPFQMQIKKQ